jgi:hypothetical protein
VNFYGIKDRDFLKQGGSGSKVKQMSTKIAKKAAPGG